jgi:hypothetical protein
MILISEFGALSIQNPFTAEAQGTLRQRRGITEASVNLCVASAFSAPLR